MRPIVTHVRWSQAWTQAAGPANLHGKGYFLGRRDNTWACPDLPSERTAELVGLRHVPTQHASEISRSSAGAINNWILTTTMRWVIALGAPVATFHSCHFMAASSSRCALAMHESFNLVNVYKNVLNEIDRQWRQIRSVYSFKCVQWITDPKSSCLAKCSSQNSNENWIFFIWSWHISSDSYSKNSYTEAP